MCVIVISLFSQGRFRSATVSVNASSVESSDLLSVTSVKVGGPHLGSNCGSISCIRLPYLSNYSYNYIFTVALSIFGIPWVASCSRALYLYRRFVKSCTSKTLTQTTVFSCTPSWGKNSSAREREGSCFLLPSPIAMLTSTSETRQGRRLCTAPLRYVVVKNALIFQSYGWTMVIIHDCIIYVW